MHEILWFPLLKTNYAHMKPILIIDCGSSKVPAIEKMVTETAASYITIKLNNLNILPDTSGIIISGAPILLTEVDPVPYLQKAKILFANEHLPILGICFGHQLMGILHGSKVCRCNEDRDWQTIFIKEPSHLIPLKFDEEKFMEDHCECIDLPASFNLLGSSGTCENEMMAHRANPWYGVQFHPEVSEKSGYDLIANFIAICRKHDA
jgi:GMP synthase (glutamine-hydrolysing)